VAIADRDTKLAEKVAGEYNCIAYDDYRRLITEMDSRPRAESRTSLRGNNKEGPNDTQGGDIRCLLVAAGMHSCDEHIRMAMRKKFNILKLAPPARNFEEAAGFVQLADDEKVKFAIANVSRFAASYLALRDFLQEGGMDQIFLITAFCSLGDQPLPAWQSDPKLAGGGVLLHNCYQIIDQILCNFPTPQQVYSLNVSSAGDRQQRLYLTEDTAVVMMKFSDTVIGNLIASKGIGPKREFLKIYSKDKILTVSNTRLTVSNAAGQVMQDFQYDDDQLVGMTKAVENFAMSVLRPDKNKLFSTGRENLKDMAVIESAYLSGRTAMPEEPARILQMAQTEPINIWPGHNQ
jgi:predicted dehydrogenase